MRVHSLDSALSLRKSRMDPPRHGRPSALRHTDLRYVAEYIKIIQRVLTTNKSRFIVKVPDAHNQDRLIRAKEFKWH
jgi:hypothetical protein